MAELTPEQAAAAAATDAAAAGATPAQADQAATTAATAAAPGISKEAADAIADATIARLEARGAFDNAPSPNSPSDAGGGQTPPPADAPSPPPADGGTPPADKPPRKRTWAERFTSGHHH